MTYIVDYTQDETGKWTAAYRELRGRTREGNAVVGMSFHMRPRADFVDCVSDVYDAVGDDATLEVGDVREWPGLGL
jgi:hypothetical protein